MIHRLMAAACVFASAAHADPLFQDISAGLPDHHYTGGWEHFVGGGVSAFDCSGDGLPDLVAAGGTAPLLLLKNVSDTGEIAFERAVIDPEITGATGVYPVDTDGGGLLVHDAVRVGS